MKADDRYGERPFVPGEQLTVTELPSGIDRRTFMMRSAVIGAPGVMTGCTMSESGLAVSVVLC